MNTATQLLERCKEHIENLEDEGYYKVISREEKRDLLKDIEACLAKQQNKDKQS